MKKRVFRISKIIFIMYCVILIVVLFLRNGRNFSLEFSSLGERLDENANLVPFKTIKNYLSALEAGNVSVSVVRINILGNFLLFLPLGYFLPKFSSKVGFINNEVRVLAIIAGAETLQLLTGLGILMLYTLIGVSYCLLHDLGESRSLYIVTFN